MVPETRLVNPAKPGSPFADKTVEIAEVTGEGSSASDRFFTSKESTLSLHWALTKSVKDSGIFKDVITSDNGAAADYVLHAEVVRQELSGFSASVDVKYSLVERAGNHEIWHDDITTDEVDNPGLLAILFVGAGNFQHSARVKAFQKNINQMLLGIQLAE